MQFLRDLRLSSRDLVNIMFGISAHMLVLVRVDWCRAWFLLCCSLASLDRAMMYVFVVHVHERPLGALM